MSFPIRPTIDCSSARQNRVMVVDEDSGKLLGEVADINGCAPIEVGPILGSVKGAEMPLIPTMRLVALSGTCAPLLLLSSAAVSTDHAQSTAAPASAPTGLILQQAEGERRVRRRPPTSVATLAAPFIIKVDTRNGGSPDFFMGYEDIPPGGAIAPHHHPQADEILFIHRGSGVASLGSREATVSEGATIYIPPNTRVALRNIGATPLSIVFIFPRPEMAQYFRDASVPEGEQPVPFSAEEFAAMRARHSQHVVFDK